MNTRENDGRVEEELLGSPPMGRSGGRSFSPLVDWLDDCQVDCEETGVRALQCGSPLGGRSERGSNSSVWCGVPILSPCLGRAE